MAEDGVNANGPRGRKKLAPALNWFLARSIAEADATLARGWHELTITYVAFAQHAALNSQENLSAWVESTWRCVRQTHAQE
jgi:hypothetical protein